jgi:hypothetical protein
MVRTQKPKKAMQAMLHMNKLDIVILKQAYEEG